LSVQCETVAGLSLLIAAPDAMTARLLTWVANNAWQAAALRRLLIGT
jgi:hypothetical protein